MTPTLFFLFCRHYPKQSFTMVADTPENLRLKQQSELQSQVSGWARRGGAAVVTPGFGKGPLSCAHQQGGGAEILALALCLVSLPPPLPPVTSYPLISLKEWRRACPVSYLKWVGEVSFFSGILLQDP